MNDFPKSVATAKEAVHVYQDVRTTLELKSLVGWSSFPTTKWSREAFPRWIDLRHKAKHLKQSLTFHRFLACNGMWKMTLRKFVTVLTRKCRTIKATGSAFVCAIVVWPIGVLCTVHDEKANPTGDNLGQKWTTVGLWYSGSRRKEVLGVGQRTSEKEKHASEKTTFLDERYQKIDLHIFSDFSLESMGRLAYLPAEDDEGVEFSFVIEKCKLAPTKTSFKRNFKLLQN